MTPSISSQVESTSTDFKDTQLKMGFWMLFSVLILLLVLLIILIAIIIRIKIVNTRRIKLPATNPQTVDLLAVNQQSPREDGIYSSADEPSESNGYATVCSESPDRNRLGAQFPATHNTSPANPAPNAARDDFQRGRTGRLDFLQHANIHEAVFRNDHQELVEAGSAFKDTNELLAHQTVSTTGWEKQFPQPTCSVKDSLIIGADGTQYLQMNNVQASLQTPTNSRKPPTQTSNAFATSTYVHIDHSFTVPLN